MLFKYEEKRDLQPATPVKIPYKKKRNTWSIILPLFTCVLVVFLIFSIKRTLKTYHPLLVALKPIMVEGFDCDSETRPWFDWSGPILFNPTLEHTAEAAFSKKTLWSEVTRRRLEFLECELTQLRGNLELLTDFGRGDAVSVAGGGCGWARNHR